MCERGVERFNSNNWYQINWFNLEEMSKILLSSAMLRSSNTDSTTSLRLAARGCDNVEAPCEVVANNVAWCYVFGNGTPKTYGVKPLVMAIFIILRRGGGARSLRDLHEQWCDAIGEHAQTVVQSR